MRPAFSVIFFTVVSGCGYGLLFLLGLALASRPAELDRYEILIELLAGAAMVGAGLLSSTLHLGQPQRAWRAFSQWRTSWLSREGVASVASFVPMAALAWWLYSGGTNACLRIGGGALAALAIVTVVCTAQIYACLKTIPAWHNRWVVRGYLLLGFLGGAAWLLALQWLLRDANAAPTALCPLIIIVAVYAALVKTMYWRSIDDARPVATTASATGLGRLGTVRSLEAPHTEENYLTHEMGFALARKHAQRLRGVCIVLLAAAPAALALFVQMAGARLPALASFAACLSALCVTAGLFVERWLFFAQAKHVVMTFYGARSA